MFRMFALFGPTNSLRRAAVAVLLGMIFCSLPARADAPVNFVQLTCAPELNYFMVRTFTVSNAPAPDRVRKYGIYLLSDLRKRPLTCTIDQVRLAFRLTGYKQPQAEGNCGAVEDAKAIVTVNGETRVAMLYTHGGCWNSVTHMIEVFWYPGRPRYPGANLYVLRHCRTIEDLLQIQYDEPDKDEHIPGTRCTETDYTIEQSREQKAP